jgi:hypothetical protein
LREPRTCIQFTAPASDKVSSKKNGRAEGRKMRFVNTIRVLAIMAAMLAGMAWPAAASAQVAVEFSVGFAPPELPVYEQPICPGEGYIWTPGYWAWDDDDGDYYWVPGTWVESPQVGYLWTPGYWGWGGKAYVFHVGYWGPVVGFYGGIDYGYGYIGHGYYGGRWDGDHFYYNRAVNNVNVTVIHNVYETRVENNVNVTRVSYNGGNGGVNLRPTPQEEAAARERHIGPVPIQNQHIQAARTNRELHASENHGKPPIAATAKPATFSGGGVVPAKAGGKYNPPANRGGNAANRPANENRAANGNRPANENNRPPNNRAENNNPNRPPAAGSNPNRPPNASNKAETNNRSTYNHSNELPRHNAPQAETNANQKYQQQQEKLAQKQNQEHQRLQQQQDREHQRVQQQSANAPRQQQMEQRHQQQTQQMEQKHQQQTQKLEQRQQPRQQAPPPRQQNQEKKPPH